MPHIITHNAAVTGNDFTGLIDPRNYGFSTGATGPENKTAFESAQATAQAEGKGLYIPPGTYLLSKVLYDPFVPLRGASWKHSILKSNAAESLISYTGTPYKNLVDIRDITLNGSQANGTSKLGVRGLELQSASNINVQNVCIEHFSWSGADLRGVLVGKFTNCMFHQNVVGVRTDNDPDSQLGIGLASSHIVFDTCVSNINTQWAYKLKDGGNHQFWACDAEDNGTQGNADTGVIQLTNSNASSLHIGVGVTIKGGWFERNKGTLLDLMEPQGKFEDRMKNIIDGTSIHSNPNLSFVARVRGTTGLHQLIIQDSFIASNGTAAVQGDGAFAQVINRNSIIDHHTELNGATYTV